MFRKLIVFDPLKSAFSVTHETPTRKYINTHELIKFGLFYLKKVDVNTQKLDEHFFYFLKESLK